MFEMALAPLPTYTPAMEDIGQDRDNLIRSYFNQGYSYKNIADMLLHVHAISVSVSHLKRLLKRMGLRRRVACTRHQLERVVIAIQQELQGSGRFLGYKSLWRRLCNKGILVPRDVVRHALLQLDPQGVAERKRRRLRRRKYINPGPDYLWHVDGYNKLKPFGFAIHGAIDGYSRKIIWLEVGPSNNNPIVVAAYYLQALCQMKRVPRIVRCDLGTENIHLARLQPYFRHGDDDQQNVVNSFLYGKSTANQRIEAWWGILRRQGAEHWISLFKDMRDGGLLNTHNPIHVQALRFSFYGTYQE